MTDKRATEVAAGILADVRAGGWPVGEVLGAEVELMRRYGVSRAVFREAVRLVEHQGVAVTRRGPGGGLVVAAPSLEAVTEAAVTYLLYRKVDVADVLEVRAVIEREVAELAARRATERQRAELIRLVALERSRAPEPEHTAASHLAFHVRLAEAGGNPVLELLVVVLARIGALFVPVEPVSSSAAPGSTVAHERIAAAIAAGDAWAARQRMGRHVDEMERWLRHRATPTPGSDAVRRTLESGKRAQQVAHEVLGEIVTAGWPVGRVLGSQAELAKRYGVSANILREAARLLEFHRVAAMRRGPGGGLVVDAPDVLPVIAAARAYVEYRAITPAQLTEAWAPIQRAAVGRCAGAASGDDVAELRRVLEAGRRARFRRSADYAGFDVAVAELAGNPVVVMFVQLLTHVTLHRVPELSDAETERHVDDAYLARVRIVDAMAAHEVDAAVRRTDRFLTALQSVTS